MKKKVLVTGRLPEEIMADLRRHCDVIANPGDDPMAYGAIASAIADRDGLL